MSDKIRIEFQSGSVVEGILPAGLASTFAYAELPTQITVSNCPTTLERKDAIQQILQVTTVTDDFIKGYVIADDTIWRDLVEILFGSSGLADYDALMTSMDTSTEGVAIYP